MINRNNMQALGSSVATSLLANMQPGKLTIGEYYYASPSVRIGKHDWRLTVRESRCDGPVTEYQFRPAGSTVAWRNERQWPGYEDFEIGMPKNLAAKLYWPNSDAIEQSLAGCVGAREHEPCTQGVLPLF